MATPFASGKKAFGFCDLCGFRTDLRDMKREVVKQRMTGMLLCRECWSPDHPQLMLGTFPIYDPQALRNPRPDTGYYVSGTTSDGSLGGGSRVIQWGWNPVGGGNSYGSPETPNTMLMFGEVGTVTVTTS